MRVVLALTLVCLAGCGGTVIGTPGEPGKDGVDGTPGAPGKDGASAAPLAASKVYLKSIDTKVYSSSVAGVFCNAHDLLLSGGCSLLGVGPDSWLTANAPILDAEHVYEGWTCGAWHTKPSTVNVDPPILTTTVTCYPSEGR